MEATNQTGIAAILGISTRQVRNLVQEGVIVKKGEEYPIKESVDRYTAFKEERPVPYQYRETIVKSSLIPRRNDITIEEFEVPLELIQRFKSELIAANSANCILYDFAMDVLKIVGDDHFTDIERTLENNYFDREIMQDTLDFMIEDLEDKQSSSIAINESDTTP